MKTYPINNEGGVTFAFEVENAYIRPRTIAAVLTGVAGVTDIRLRKPFSSSSDTHLRFRYRDREFLVWEPFGDNSRYWIGPADKKNTINVEDLRAVFDSYVPPLLTKCFGDLITLNFRALFRR